MAYADDVDRRRRFRAEQVERFGPGADFEVDGDGGIDRHEQVILPEKKARQRAWQQFWIHSGIQFDNLKPGAAVEQVLMMKTLQKLCPNADRIGPPTGAKLAELIIRLKAVQAVEHVNPKKKAERKSSRPDAKVAPIAAVGKAKPTETSETPAAATVATTAAPAPQTNSKSKKKKPAQTEAEPAAIAAASKPRSAIEAAAAYKAARLAAAQAAK